MSEPHSVVLEHIKAEAQRQWDEIRQQTSPPTAWRPYFRQCPFGPHALTFALRWDRDLASLFADSTTKPAGTVTEACCEEVRADIKAYLAATAAVASTHTAP